MKINSGELDRYITGNYGEDQFRQFEEEEMEKKYVVFFDDMIGRLYAGNVDDWETVNVIWEKKEELAGLFTQWEANQIAHEWHADIEEA